MNFNDAVKYSMFMYPSLYSEKWQVLEHFFALNGNAMN